MSPANTRSKSQQDQRASSTPPIPATKRILSPDAPETTVSNSKKQKKYKMSAQDINEIKKCIVESNNSLLAKMESTHSSLESKIDGLASQVSAEVSTLKESFEQLRSKVSCDVNEIENILHEHTTRIENNEDDLERMQLNSDLRISGFPVRDGENLLDLYHYISSEIGYDSNFQTYPTSIERVPMLNRATGLQMPSTTIMIHFAAPRLKQMFYSLYLNKMPLDPKKIRLIRIKSHRNWGTLNQKKCTNF